MDQVFAHNPPSEVVCAVSFGQQTIARMEYDLRQFILNINEGHNQELLEQCLWLKKYSDFVSSVKRYRESMSIKEAVDKTMNEFIAGNDEFGKLLSRHRAEVADMCITEFNEKVYEDGIREEGLEEGLAKGLLF